VAQEEVAMEYAMAMGQRMGNGFLGLRRGFGRGRHISHSRAA